MPYPGLLDNDHKILGSEYCSGYTDVFGKWNTGFYCPQTGSTSAVFCCGTSYFKYCCTTKPTLEDEDQDETATSPYTVRIPVFFAIFCGVLAVVILLITAICFFCSCCVVYKKRRDAASSSGLYRIQGSSSTASALASIYSNQNNSSVVTTPLDTAEWTTQLPVSASAYIPYPFSQSTPLTTSYPSSVPIPHARYSNVSINNNNNNNIPAFYYNNFNALNNNNNSQFSSLSNLYQYQRPLSAMSTVSSYSSNSTALSFPLQHQQQQQRVQNGYCLTNLPRSQQGYFYRQLTGQNPSNSNIQQTAAQLNSYSSNPCPFPPEANTRQQQSRFINQNNNNNTRHLQPQHNGYQQSLPYTNNNTSTGIASSGRPRTQTQGNHLNQQQQERLATVQSLISAYRANSVSAPGGIPVVVGTRNRPASLSNMDVNRLNAINLLVSAVLNQNRRNCNAGGTASGNNTGANANGVIRVSGGTARGESISPTPTIATTDSIPCVTLAGNNSTDLINNKSNNNHNGSSIILSADEDISLSKECKTNEQPNENEECVENPNSDQNIATSVPLILVENDYEKRPEHFNSKIQDGDNPDDNVKDDISSTTTTILLGGESEPSKLETSVSVNEFSEHLQTCHIEQNLQDEPTKIPTYSKDCKEKLDFTTHEDVEPHVTNLESCKQE